MFRGRSCGQDRSTEARLAGTNPFGAHLGLLPYSPTAHTHTARGLRQPLFRNPAASTGARLTTALYHQNPSEDERLWGAGIRTGPPGIYGPAWVDSSKFAVRILPIGARYMLGTVAWGEPWVETRLRLAHLPSHVNLLATYKFALASRRSKLSLAACTCRIFSSSV